MIDVNQLIEHVLTPCLNDLQAYSNDAIELLVMTCAIESDGGSFIKQVNGPALGIFQMEEATHDDLWHNFLMHDHRRLTLMQVHFNCQIFPSANRMVTDLRYAAAMARLLYARFPDRLPDKDDIEGLYDYYKKFYNTEKGKSKKAPSIKKYTTYRGLGQSKATQK